MMDWLVYHVKKAHGFNHYTPEMQVLDLIFTWLYLRRFSESTYQFVVFDSFKSGWINRREINQLFEIVLLCIDYPCHPLDKLHLAYFNMIQFAQFRIEYQSLLDWQASGVRFVAQNDSKRAKPWTGFSWLHEKLKNA